MRARPLSIVTSLEQSLSLIKVMLSSSSDGILITAIDGSLIDYNQKFVNLWEIPEAVLDTNDQKKVFEFIHSQLSDPKDILVCLRGVYAPIEMSSMDILKFNDGRVIERCSYPYKVNDQLVGKLWRFKDVSRCAELEEALQHQAMHDLLTGLPNRALLFDRINQAISVHNRDKSIFAVCLLDLDRFKIINESFSHKVGDEVLCIVAKRLEKVLRSGDTLARISGDQFVIVLTDIAEEKMVSNIIKKFLEIFLNPFKIVNREITMTASIGVALYSKDGEDVDTLLQNADTAVCRSKEYGANRIEFYTELMNKQSLIRLDKEMQLRRAVIENQFFLQYQPQLNFQTRKLIGVEALIRWQHPEVGVIQPLDFISLAEETGLIIPIGEWVLRTACQQAKRWQTMGLPYFRIAVNVSELQMKQQNLVDTIKRILEETELESKYLELEINENVIINNQNVIRVITALKQMGIQITLDDFGTGSSSLSYLKKVPLDRLKIDYVFMKHIPENQDDTEIVRAIVAMSKAFGLEVVAEGIEKEEQIKFLEKENCNYVQGFYFSHPLLHDEFESFVIRSHY